MANTIQLKRRLSGLAGAPAALESGELAHSVLAAVVAKAQFWERAAPMPLNDRQIKVLNRLLDGFEGKMTTSKWATIAKCSQDSASRDIATLIELGLMRKGAAGGRSTNYELVL